MTDKEKLDKLVAEIEKVKVIIQANKGQGAFSEGYIIGQESVIEHLESFVGSMQEEAKKEAAIKVEQIIAEVDAKFPKFSKDVKDMQEEPKPDIECNPNARKPTLVIRKGEKYMCVKKYQDKNCTFTVGKIYQSDKDGFLVDDENKDTFERKIWEEDACEYFVPSLEKEPKFKVGDTVRYKYNHILTKPRTIAEICGTSHYIDADGCRMDMAYTDANFKVVGESASKVELNAMLDETLSKETEESWNERLDKEPVSENFKAALEKKVREAQDWTYIEEEGGECPLNEEFGADELEEFAKWGADWVRKNEKEPVSEDLEKAAADYENNMWEAGHTEDTYTSTDIIKAVKFGANWQKQQMEAYRIEHCKSLTNEQAELEENFVSSHVEKNNRIPTFLDAIEYGIEYGKQQMLKDAICTIMQKDDCGDIVPTLANQYRFNVGDKVKVLVIKEE